MSFATFIRSRQFYALLMVSVLFVGLGIAQGIGFSATPENASSLNAPNALSFMRAAADLADQDDNGEPEEALDGGSSFSQALGALSYTVGANVPDESLKTQIDRELFDVARLGDFWTEEAVKVIGFNWSLSVDESQEWIISQLEDRGWNVMLNDDIYALSARKSDGAITWMMAGFVQYDDSCTVVVQYE